MFSMMSCGTMHSILVVFPKLVNEINPSALLSSDVAAVCQCYVTGASGYHLTFLFVVPVLFTLPSHALLCVKEAI